MNFKMKDTKSVKKIQVEVCIKAVHESMRHQTRCVWKSYLKGKIYDSSQRGLKHSLTIVINKSIQK